jgi:hypothetical protein
MGDFRRRIENMEWEDLSHYYSLIVTGLGIWDVAKPGDCNKTRKKESEKQMSPGQRMSNLVLPSVQHMADLMTRTNSSSMEDCWLHGGLLASHILPQNSQILQKRIREWTSV